MKKILPERIIERCKDCDWCKPNLPGCMNAEETYFYSDDGYSECDYRPLITVDGIPHWCPLTDANVNHHKNSKKK